MIGFPHEGSAQYDFIRKQTKDRESKEDFEFPVEYMFKDVPKGLPTDDPVSLVLQQMDRFGIERAMIGVGEEAAALALKMQQMMTSTVPEARVTLDEMYRTNVDMFNRLLDGVAPEEIPKCELRNQRRVGQRGHCDAHGESDVGRIDEPGRMGGASAS